MKVPAHVVRARRQRLARLIDSHRYLPLRELCRILGVSAATARRDLAFLQRERLITRTHGGALAEFDERFPSFRERQQRGGPAKAAIGRLARRLLRPGLTCFLDTGTTVHALAEAFAANPVTPLTFVTSNLPAGELLAAIEGVTVFQVAGQLFHRQAVLLGEYARRSIAFWRFDFAFVSAEGMDARGLWNSTPEIVSQQRVGMRRAARTVYCLDAAKLRHGAAHLLARWEDVDYLVTDASPARLRQAGIELAADRLLSPAVAAAPAMPPTGPADGGLPVHAL